MPRRAPGEVRDAILKVLRRRKRDASIQEITVGVERQIGPVAASSIRSYLRLASLGDQARLRRTARGRYELRR